MFGKIRDKLKSVFEKNEEVIDEGEDNVENLDQVEDSKEVKKDSKSEGVKEDSSSKLEEPQTQEAPEEEPNENEPSEDMPVEEKKGFLSRVFGKKEVKEESDVEELSEIQDEMLEGVDDEEKDAIKEKKEIKNTEENKEKLEAEIEKEELQEKEELKEVEEKEDSKLKTEEVVETPKVEVGEIPEKKEVEEQKGVGSKDVEKQKSVEIVEEKQADKDVDDKAVEKNKEEVVSKKPVKKDFVEEGQLEESPVEEKKGFLSRVFGKKEEVSHEEADILEEKEKELVEEGKLEEIDEEPKQEEDKEGFISKTFSKLKSKKITEEDFDKIWIELEVFLLEINIAYEIVEKVEVNLREQLLGNSFNRFALTEKIKEVMAKEVEKVLKKRESNFLDKLKEIKEKDQLVKILILGVNGTGKTTTIAKVVKYLKDNNLKVVVAAADTFRAAAIEQLEEHSKKLDFKLIQHKGGSDPAAVAFDAIEHAKAKQLDVVLIDTAGRMPNNSNLMQELQKIKKVSNSQMAIFIGDSISGNDLIDQIELFNQGVEIDGVILTKVDTDDKPGSVVTTAYSIEKPIFFLGAGQTYEDLHVFESKTISEKLFGIDDE